MEHMAELCSSFRQGAEIRHMVRYNLVDEQQIKPQNNLSHDGYE